MYLAAIAPPLPACMSGNSLLFGRRRDAALTATSRTYSASAYRPVVNWYRQRHRAADALARNHCSVEGRRYCAGVAVADEDIACIHTTWTWRALDAVAMTRSNRVFYRLLPSKQTLARTRAAERPPLILANNV